ncbi:MAG: YncE family protein [Gammaproteobacteria bacterium]
MKKAMSRCLLLLGLAFPLIATAAPVSSRYLFVWAMEAKHPHASTLALAPTDRAAWRKTLGLGKDFLAVFDVRPGPSFGKLITMLPVGRAVMAHHTNYAEPPNDVLYANDWLGNRTYVLDLRDPLHPRLLRKFGGVGAFSYPHSFVYLPNGDTLATFQYSGGFNHAAGGLVEFDPQGRVVRTAAAAVPGHPDIRPYSLAVVAKLNRVVTGSADMMGAQVSHVVQVWRLSDLKLIKTMRLPPQPHWFYDTAADSSEPRVLADGKTILVPTFNCGLFLVRNLASGNPTLQHIYDFGYRTCEVPVVAGDFLVETMQSGHAIVSLDVHAPEHPHEVSRILLPPDEYPHWLTLEPGGDRLAITGYGALDTRVRFATIDRRTGKLTLEPSTIDFTRAWPDGWQGSAIPHGAVFSNP